ncbi:hypothetical protein [Nonomuraea sp. LPB2021202275-12-8]|uniref:hypothetical protein n=1 Tax=Nonomuraea sp. LPB2021202275-12-8 TaxID=3120159 RepID=UPI00300C8A43
MHPDLHLQLERIRADDLRAAARHWRLTRERPARTAAVRRRLGWILVETGLRLVHRADLQRT